MKKQISLSSFWSSTGANAEAVAKEYNVGRAGSLRLTPKGSPQPVAPTARAATHVGAAVPGGTYKTISIGLPPIGFGLPPDFGDLHPIAIDDKHPPPEGHSDRREDKERFRDLHEDLDKLLKDLCDPDYNQDPNDPYWHPPEPDDSIPTIPDPPPDPSARGGGGGGGG